MSKKILSIALAVVMLFSVVTVSAFAITAPNSGEAAIYVTSDAKVGQKDGKVTVNVYYVFPAGLVDDSYLAGIANFVLGINSAKYSFASFTWGPSYSIMAPAQTQVAISNSSKGLFKAVASKLTESDKANGYNMALQFNMKYGDSSVNPDNYSAKTGFPITVDEENKALVATVELNVLDSLTAADGIGILEATLNNQTQVKYRDAAGKFQKFTAVMPDGTSAPAGETYKVFDGDVKIRRNAADSAKYDLGFTGSFKKSDFPVVFTDAGTATNLTQVGVKVTMNGVTNEYTDRFVYETADGYQFRAVLAGLEDSMAATEISVVMFIVFDGVRYESKGLTTTLGAHTGRLPA